MALLPCMAKINDTEVYRRYCLIGFIDDQTGKVVSIEAVDKPFSQADRNWLKAYMRKNLVVTFNGNGFDLPIIYGAIAGLSPKMLKKMADRIILDNQKPWDIEEEFDIKIPRNLDHIDLMEVAPGAGSLKIFGGRLHGRRMQDLPIPPDADLTDEEIEIIYEYWKNDLEVTVLLWKALKTPLDLRKAMSKEYGVDLRSKSDAQVAEAVIKADLTKILGKAPVKPEFKQSSRQHYHIPDYIRVWSPELNDILDRIEGTSFSLSPSGKVELPDWLAKAAIPIGNGVYRMGIGGLHSSETCVAHVADGTFHIFDRDVASYYPRIILNLKLFPKQLGKSFLKVYERIVNRRLEAKADVGRITAEIADLEKRIAQSNDGGSLMKETIVDLKRALDKATVAMEGLKITINGSFGKLGSKWSLLYAPDLMIQTTITGQLSLLMLIDRFHRKNFEVISANTDGVIVKVPNERVDEYLAVVKKWEADTQFVTEETEYSAVYSRDVNNYVAVKKKDNTAKRKGEYAKGGLQEKKNPTNEICSEAVCELLTKGTPLSETIKGCRDIRKFVTVRNVNGGAIKDGKYLGKAIRWYQSTSTDTAIHYKKANESGNHNKVPKSDGGMPCMLLPDALPDDIDFVWYIKEARSMLKDINFEPDLIGKPTRKKRTLKNA